jgi:hypothetical protein
MTIESIWAAHRDGVDLESLVPKATTAEESFYLAMLAVQAGDDARAAGLAARAADLEPRHNVYVEAARYLRAGHIADVYSGPAAFTAFASGGGNVALYRAVHDTLRRTYARERPARLLDIGTGEGHALLPSITGDVGHVELVEPSHDRLSLVTAELSRRGVPHRGHTVTIQQFMNDAGERSWNLVQETFALLTLARPDRLRLFQWLRPRARRLALVEFDVPDSNSGMQPPWFRHVVSRYNRGIGEYAGPQRDLVAQGFLIPVLFGVLGDEGHQQHHEQPIRSWLTDLRAAGFRVDATPLHDYWWAPAYVLHAT